MVARHGYRTIIAERGAAMTSEGAHLWLALQLIAGTHPLLLIYSKHPDLGLQLLRCNYLSARGTLQEEEADL